MVMPWVGVLVQIVAVEADAVSAEVAVAATAMHCSIFSLQTKVVELKLIQLGSNHLQYHR